MLSDSTNSEHDTRAGSEALVAEALAEHIGRAKGALVIGLFASNMERMRTLANLAQRFGRKVMVLGRSMKTQMEVARNLGKFENAPGLVVDIARADSYPRSQLLLLATGSQAEAHGALSRLARGEIREFEVQDGDTVILSSRVIPGNELEVAKLEDAFLRLGAKLVSGRSDPRVHVSGHAARDEQRAMLDLIEPQSFVPVHGTLAHLQTHAETARGMGVGACQVFENGEEFVLFDRKLSAGEDFTSGIVRRIAGRSLPLDALTQRREVAERGLVIVFLAPSGAPTVVTCGVVDRQAGAGLEQAIGREVTRAVAEAPPHEAPAEVAKRAARRVIQERLGYRTNVLVRAQ
jgi:ribonuclease J